MKTLLSKKKGQSVPVWNQIALQVYSWNSPEFIPRFISGFIRVYSGLSPSIPFLMN